jgi:hypothetical protein
VPVANHRPQRAGRMLQMRARSFALRDAFPDVLEGLISVEEALDNHSGCAVTTVPNQPIRASVPLLASARAFGASSTTTPADAMSMPTAAHVASAAASAIASGAVV